MYTEYLKISLLLKLIIEKLIQNLFKVKVEKGITKILTESRLDNKVSPRECVGKINSIINSSCDIVYCANLLVHVLNLDYLIKTTSHDTMISLENDLCIVIIFKLYLL